MISYFICDDVFFNRNWAGACWNCWVGLLALDVGHLCKKQETKNIDGGSPVTSLMPKSVLKKRSTA